MTLHLPTSGFRFGDVVYPPGSTLGPRIQSVVQLVYVNYGSCRVRVDSTEYAIRPGTGILLFPGHEEYFAFDRALKTRHGWVEYTPVERRPHGAARPIVVDLPPEVLAIAHGGYLASRQTVASMPAARDATARLVFEAFLARSEVGFVDDRYPAQLSRVLAHIDDNWSESLDLNALADVGAVSPTHLNRLFQRYCGITAMRYLWRYRASEALVLIKSTSLSFQEIADRCGFSNPFHLSRVVSREYGKPPLGLRKEAVEGLL